MMAGAEAVGRKVEQRRSEAGKAVREMTKKAKSERRAQKWEQREKRRGMGLN